MHVNLASPQFAKQDDLPAIAQLLAKVFGSDRSWLEELSWQYLDNPAGPAVYVNGFDEGGALMAHYAVIPTSPFADEKFSGIKTYLSLNTAVHPSAQGQGLFKKTATAVYNHLATLGPHAVLGVANENSVHGFISSLGFYLLGQLRVEAYFPGTIPRAGAPRLLSPSDEAVRWRLNRPHGGYQIQKGLPLCTRPHKGIPVRCLLSSGGLNLGLANLSETSIFNRWTRPAICASYGPTDQFAWLVPETMRPSPFNLIFRPAYEGSPLPLLNHIQTRRFELFDFDVV
jgi:GNAT superfamily N-acetyltransferase